MKKIYLDNTPLSVAVKKWTDKLVSSGFYMSMRGENIDTIDSLGSITDEVVSAKISSPFYHSSAMDGYAVKFADTFGASERSPNQLKIHDQAIYVSTGDPIPDDFNAVIMIEDVNIISSQGSGIGGRGSENEYIEIIKPATPWQHVRTVGEDIVTTELIVPLNHRIRPVDIGAMLAGGFNKVRVRKKPKVVIIPTGDELVENVEIGKLSKGQIIESNSRILSALVTEWGGEPIRFEIVPDRIDELKKALEEASERGDIIAVNAGASVGKKDFTSMVISELGEVILHGVNIKPGKPVILGWIHNKPVIGVPGYPVSAYIVFEIFIKPVIHKYLGIEMEKPVLLSASLSRQIASTVGIEEFIRVKIGKVGERIMASPVGRGAGLLMSLVKADGFLRIPAMSEGLGAGTEVKIELIKHMNKISNTIVCIGSHDNIIDVLANSLKKKYPEYSLSSAHVGSIGGIIALKRGEAHIAGTHLLDEATGEYNVHDIKRLIPDEKIILINLVYRLQGLFVLKGNPKKIKGFKDLLREEIAFVNRQPGSGTRLLTDKYLKELNIDTERVNGYQNEEYTHLTVASAVLNGMADTGLGIYSASKALGLDFIPLANERYDFALPEKFYKIKMIQSLFDIIRNDIKFKDTVIKLGGYDTRDMGKIMYPEPS